MQKKSIWPMEKKVLLPIQCKTDNFQTKLEQ